MTSLPRPLGALALTGLLACSGGSGVDEDGMPTSAAGLIDLYAQAVTAPYAGWRAAEWAAHTQVRPDDETPALRAMDAYQVWVGAVSDPEWIRAARDLARAEADGRLKPQPELGEMAAIEAIRRVARRHPASASETVTALDDALGQVARFRRRSSPKLAGEPIRADVLAQRYAVEPDPAERARLWTAMLAPARNLKPGFLQLRDLRNEVARKGGWKHHLAATTDAYGLEPEDQLATAKTMLAELRPLYQQLHTWMRYELAKRYEVDPPDALPVHWLPTPLGEDWSGIGARDAAMLGDSLEGLGPQAMLQQVEGFYTGLGLEPLPPTFWENSSLYPPATGDAYAKSGGAFTLDLDLAGDTRVLLNTAADETSLHAAVREIGFAHAEQIRRTAGVPMPLRMTDPGPLLGALTTWADLIATRGPRLVEAGILPPSGVDAEAELLDEALAYVPFVQYQLGTAFHFEHAVYADALPDGRLTTTWWALAERYQGVAPPELRTERWADPLFKTTFTTGGGSSLDHALSILLAFQLHDAMCRELGLDPREADLGGRPEVGAYFQRVAQRAGTDDWQVVIEEVTGGPPSANAMARYFGPLLARLQAANRTRRSTMPTLR